MRNEFPRPEDEPSALIIQSAYPPYHFYAVGWAPRAQLEQHVVKYSAMDWSKPIIVPEHTLDATLRLLNG